MSERPARPESTTSELPARFELEHAHMMQPTFTIEGRRWFERKDGNTYHVAVVRLSDGRELRSERTYGYGDHYLVTAIGLLNAAGFDLPRRGSWRDLQAAGMTHYYATDVAEESEL